MFEGLLFTKKSKNLKSLKDTPRILIMNEKLYTPKEFCNEADGVSNLFLSYVWIF
jgi:hypothetical protein